VDGIQRLGGSGVRPEELGAEGVRAGLVFAEQEQQQPSEERVHPDIRQGELQPGGAGDRVEQVRGEEPDFPAEELAVLAAGADVLPEQVLQEVRAAERGAEELRGLQLHVRDDPAGVLELGRLLPVAAERGPKEQGAERVLHNLPVAEGTPVSKKRVLEFFVDCPVNEKRLAIISLLTVASGQADVENFLNIVLSMLQSGYKNPAYTQVAYLCSCTRWSTSCATSASPSRTSTCCSASTTTSSS